MCSACLRTSQPTVRTILSTFGLGQLFVSGSGAPLKTVQKKQGKNIDIYAHFELILAWKNTLCIWNHAGSLGKWFITGSETFWACSPPLIRFLWKDITKKHCLHILPKWGGGAARPVLKSCYVCDRGPLGVFCVLKSITANVNNNSEHIWSRSTFCVWIIFTSEHASKRGYLWHTLC